MDTRWYRSVSASDDTLFDTLTILHDLLTAAPIHTWRRSLIATCRPHRPLYPVNTCSAPRATCTVTTAVACCWSRQRCWCSLKKTFTCQTTVSNWHDSWPTRHDESCVLFLTSAYVTPNLDFCYSILHVIHLVCSHIWYQYLVSQNNQQTSSWSITLMLVRYQIAPRSIGILVSATYWYRSFTTHLVSFPKTAISVKNRA